MPGRVRRAVNKANSRISIQLAAGLLASSSLIASMLGLFRDRLLNSTYAATYPVGLDAFTVANIVPEFMFLLLTSGALSVTFIPVFNDRFMGGNKKSAWAISSSMINFMALITLVASVAIMILADPIVHMVAPGLDEQGHGLAVSMMRVIAVNPFIFAVSSVIASIQQAVGRFTFFALAPVLYNLGIIIGITVFTNGITLFGVQVFEGGIMGVALGIVLGSIAQLIVSAVGLIGLGFDYQFKISWKNQGFRKALRLLPARSLDQGIDYVNSIVEINLASRLVSGSIRVYQQALTMHYVPINLIGVAISTAAFPQMTERLSQGRPDLFKKELQTALRIIIWLALPTAVITYFCRGYLANFLFNGGNIIMASTLGILSVAILARSIYHIASRSFYAKQDTKTPLYISFFTIGLNIVLAITLTLVLNWGIYGLAWAQAIVSVVEVGILFAVMSRRITNIFDGEFLHALSRMAISATITGVICFAMVKIFDLAINDQSFAASFPKFALIVAISLASYVAVSRVFNLKESKTVIHKVESLLFFQPKGERS